MKSIFLISALLLTITAHAVTPVVVETGSTTTAPGIGGTTQIGYAFAKGDVVTIDAKASKLLERMLVFIFPETVMGRAKHTKHPQLTFTMPEDGVVVFRFISDRDGSNTIRYTVMRTPASAATQNYNTKVDWQKPTDRASTLTPVRAAN